MHGGLSRAELGTLCRLGSSMINVGDTGSQTKGMLPSREEKVNHVRKVRFFVAVVC